MGGASWAFETEPQLLPPLLFVSQRQLKGVLDSIVLEPGWLGSNPGSDAS